MILPLGNEQISFKQIPWVTFSIIILCTIIFLFTNSYDYSYKQRVDKLQDEYIEHWLKHPYVPFARNFIPDEKFEKIKIKVSNLQDQVKNKLYPIPDEEVKYKVWKIHNDILKDILNQLYQQAWHRWGYNKGRRSIFTALSHIFIHADWEHLFSNMLFLFFTGPFLEELWGRPFYLAFYIFAGLFSTIGADLIHTDLNTFSIGASGAISGVIGAFLIRFWDVKLKFLWWGVFVMGTFRAPGWIMIIFEVGRQFIYGKMQDMMSGRTEIIGYWSHLSGLIFGILVVIMIRRMKIEEIYLTPSKANKFSYTDRAYKVVMESEALISKRRIKGAYSRLSRGVKLYPLNSEIIELLWQTGEILDQNNENINYMKNLIEVEIRKGRMDKALSYFEQLRILFPEERVSLQGMILLVKEFSKNGNNYRANILANELAEKISISSPPGIILQFINAIGSKINSPAVKKVIELGVAHKEIPVEKREGLKRLLKVYV